MKKRLILGVSGNKGSFSEEAANYYCQKNEIADYDINYLINVKKTLFNLNENKIDLGIFPIENSNGGIVYEAVYAMSEYNFNIKQIFEIDIKMNLMALPEATASSIKQITSHQQALKQCRMYLKRKWPDTELMEYSDTASAAKHLSLGKLKKDNAVIAPKICAKLYGLELMEESIQDLKFNFTTFIAATKRKKDDK